MLAIALIDYPRATMKEISDAVGISKATLHRYYGTRENLKHLLIEKSIEVTLTIINFAKNSNGRHAMALKQLIDIHYENRALLRFFCAQPHVEQEYWASYTQAIDQFFLEGQKSGLFKIGFTAPFLSELFIAMISALIDAERRGRVASVGITKAVEDLFLHGLSNQK